MRLRLETDERRFDLATSKPPRNALRMSVFGSAPLGGVIRS
jgi:hypothetical protein